MKYLKRFNEAVIPAYDFTEALDKLRSMENITLDNLKEIFDDMNVEFVNVEYFKSQLQTEKEIELVPVNMPPLMGGVRWGAHNVYTNKMYICIDENEFIKSINSPLKDKLLDFLEEVLIVLILNTINYEWPSYSFKIDYRMAMEWHIIRLAW